MKILSGANQPELAKNLAKNLGLEYVNTRIDSFQDQELRVQIEGALYGEDVAIVQSTSKPANDHLMELLLLVDAAKHAGAYRIIAVIPYFGYGRQDRPSYNYGPISARLVATLLEAAGVDRIITVDLHSRQLEGFFKIGVQNLAATDLFASCFKDMKDFVVVSPDVGGLIRSRQLAESLNANLAVINKRRDKDDICYMSEVIGEVSGKHCVLIDDIVDTAGTLCLAAELLIKKGALSVEACVTHPVLSGEAIQRIEASAIKRIFITNSIPTSDLPAKFHIIHLDDLLKTAISKLIKF